MFNSSFSFSFFSNPEIFTEMMGITDNSVDSDRLLFDHRPLELNSDDYERVCRIPKKKVFFLFLLS